MATEAAAGSATATAQRPVLDTTAATFDLGKTYFLSSTWCSFSDWDALRPDDVLFRLVLTDGVKVWVGKVSKGAASNDAEIKPKRMPLAAFVETSKLALSDHDRSGQYPVSFTEATGALTWGARDRNQGTFGMGFQLQEMQRPGAMLLKLLDRMNAHWKDSKAENARLSIQATDLRERLHAAESQLEQEAVVRKQLEDELYSKFAEILNEKKRENLALRRQVKALTASGRSHTASASAGATTAATPPRRSSNGGGNGTAARQQQEPAMPMHEDTDDEVDAAASAAAAAVSSAGMQRADSIFDDFVGAGDQLSQQVRRSGAITGHKRGRSGVDKGKGKVVASPGQPASVDPSAERVMDEFFGSDG